MAANGRAPARENICGVIVTYHPDEDFEKRLARVEALVPRVVVVDNDSGDATRRRLEGLAKPRRTELILLPDNLGIGAALNRGLERAVALGFEWGLTFDQDCLPNDDMVEHLLSVHADHPNRSELGAIGSNYVEATTGTTGTPKHPTTGGPSWVDVDDVITSGCLQSLRAFRAVGGYREDFFIYFVDTDYCWRIGQAGYRVILTRKSLFLHRTGTITKHRILNREYMTPHYAPWRHYYIVRNGLLLASAEWNTDRAWAVRWARAVGRRSALSLLFEPRKVEKLRFMAKGAWHALLGKTGKLTMDRPR